MRLERKNKGFSIIEIMVVIGIMGILIAIIAANSGKQREKAAVEQMAGEVRDYLIRAGATASKIQQDLGLGIDGTQLRATVGGHNVNFEGGGNSLDLSHFQGTISIMSYDTNRLFEEVSEGSNKSFKISTSGISDISNGGVIIIKPKGLSMTSNTVTDPDGNPVAEIKKGCIRVAYGNYAIMIDVVGTGNLNMYVTANARASTADQRYFSCK